MPLSLQFAGATNVFLSELKFNDNFFDSGKLKYFWFLTKKFFNSDFKKATKNLSAWGVNVVDFYNLCNEQNKREKQELLFDSPNLALDYFSEKSSEMTAIIFKASAKVIKKETESEKMYQIGYQFGKIIYLLDALNDWKADLKSNKFNAIKASYNYQEKELSFEIRESVISSINTTYNLLISELNNLDLSTKIKDFFIKRLDHNIKKQTSLKSCRIRKNDSTYSINLNKKDHSNRKQRKVASFLCCSNLDWCDWCQLCECACDGIDLCGSCGECCSGCAECGSCC